MIEEAILQKCPLCNEMNTLDVHGVLPDKIISEDIGYSFCECRNIYYTDWNNIDQLTYDQEYVDKYSSVKNHILRYADAYFHHLIGRSGVFLEIGCIADYLLDYARKIGFNTYALDIVKRVSRHQFIHSDFESVEGLPEDISVIWASHVFEHFRDPIAALKKCYDLLKPGGVLFVAMPDSYYIKKVSDVYHWGHWHVKEHHILWEMNEWIKVCEEVGFKNIFKTRNMDFSFICRADFHAIFVK